MNRSSSHSCRQLELCAPNLRTRALAALKRLRNVAATSPQRRRNGAAAAPLPVPPTQLATLLGHQYRVRKKQCLTLNKQQQQQKHKTKKALADNKQTQATCKATRPNVDKTLATCWPTKPKLNKTLATSKQDHAQQPNQR